MSLVPAGADKLQSTRKTRGHSYQASGTGSGWTAAALHTPILHHAGAGNLLSSEIRHHKLFPPTTPHCNRVTATDAHLASAGRP